MHSSHRAQSAHHIKDALLHRSQRAIWPLGSIGAIIVALMVVSQALANMSGTSESTASQVTTQAAILPEGRDTYCNAPPALTTAKPVVNIGVSDDTSANNAPTIFVNSPNSSTLVVATLKDIQAGLASLPTPRTDLLTENVVNGQHIWTLNMHLQVGRGVTLRISGGSAAPGAQVDELRLRSIPSPGYPQLKDPNNPNSDKVYDYTSFAALRGRNGSLFIENTKITSWDTSAANGGSVDENYADGRAFILVRENASMNVCSSEIAYLGFSGGQAYGLSWRDTGTDSAGALRIRVTGDMINSKSHNNYYGVYTFQAQNMIFRNNTLYDNIQYGFDPHDYTNNVLVDSNESYNNGSHGFIISRGCTNFKFINNRSHDNKVKSGSKNPSAHGFMLDPGADPATAGVPQTPSTNNVYQGNKAYNNDGYGFRILQSNNNTIQNNEFTNNRAGISLEDASTGNVIDGNTISGSTGLTTNGVLSQGYGVQIVTGADANIITNNKINNNAVVGINIKTGKNLIQGNTITGNATNGISIAQDSGTSSDETAPPADNQIAGIQVQSAATVTPPNANQLIGNIVRSNLAKGIAISGASATVIKNNMLESNGASGVSITGNTTGTLMQNNTIDGNAVYGIEIYGTTNTQTNTMTRNLIFNNTVNAISVRNGTNGGITAPVVAAQGAGKVTGTSKPGAVIEVFSDASDEAAFYEGTTTANSAGAFSFALSSAPKGSYLTFSATDSAGNTSALSLPLSVQQVNAAGTPTATSLPTATPTKTATSTRTATPTKTVTSTKTTTAASTPATTRTPTQGATSKPVDVRYQVYLPVVQQP